MTTDPQPPKGRMAGVPSASAFGTGGGLTQEPPVVEDVQRTVEGEHDGDNSQPGCICPGIHAAK